MRGAPVDNLRQRFHLEMRWGRSRWVRWAGRGCCGPIH